MFLPKVCTYSHGVPGQDTNNNVRFAYFLGVNKEMEGRKADKETEEVKNIELFVSRFIQQRFVECVSCVEVSMTYVQYLPHLTGPRLWLSYLTDQVLGLHFLASIAPAGGDPKSPVHSSQL
jgi:hypothetical protein